MKTRALKLILTTLALSAAAVPANASALNSAEQTVTEAATEPDTEIKEYTGYFFADGDTRYLTSKDITDLTQQECCFAKNEFYARHGRKFQSVELQDYFGSTFWYRGSVEPEAFSDTVFNDYELKNIVLLQDRELELGGGNQYSLNEPGYDISLARTWNKEQVIVRAGDLPMDLPDSFWFSSGAGAWGTEIELHQDGTFVGEYHDSDMGSTGDGYPGGTVYISSCTGSFDEVTVLDDYTYSMHLNSITYDHTPGEAWIDNEVLYVASETYGLQPGSTFYLYVPGTPVSMLPEAFQQWNVAGMMLKSDILEGYAILNVEEDQVFWSWY